MSDWSPAPMAAQAGFCADPRFSDATEPPPLAVPEDPVADAHAAGYAAGYADAEAVGAARLADALAARGRIESAFAEASAANDEAVRDRLRATVKALCGEAFAIAARDGDHFLRRIDAAAALLARADDGRRLRLHPDDIDLLAGALPADLEIEADAALMPGALRFEGAAGGVVDGPDLWKAALAEALAQC